MKRILAYALVTLALFFLGSKAHSQDAGTNSTSFKSLEELASERRTRPLAEFTAEEHQIFIYERETLRAINSGKIDQLMDLFISEDAIVCPPGGEAIIGRDNQRILFKQWLSTKGVVLDYEPIGVHVGPSGDMAYAYGLVRWKNPGEFQYLGKYVSVWVKEDGRWMNHVEMRNVIHPEGDGGGGAAPRYTTADSGLQALTELAQQRRTRPLTELNADEHQIFIYERETLRAIKSGHIDELMDLFISEGAIVCPPGGEAIVGREKQKVLFKQWLGTEGVVLDYEPVDVHVGPSGDMAYAYGLVRWRNPGELQYLGKYVSVWVKENGRWMNHVEMRNVIHEEDSQ